MLHPWVLLTRTHLSDALAPLTTNIEQIKNPARQRFIGLSTLDGHLGCSFHSFFRGFMIGRVSLLRSTGEAPASDEAPLLE